MRIPRGERIAAAVGVRDLDVEQVDWLGLLDRGRLLGWVDRSEVDGTLLSDLTPRPFLVTLESDSSLRSALDAVVTSHARVAVVVDDGMFRGMLDLEAIAEEITE